MKQRSQSRAPTDRDDCVRWVTYCQQDLTEEGPIQSYALYHTIEGEPIERLCTVGKVEEKTVEAIVAELWDLAENDTETRMTGLPQRYVAHAYRSDPENADSQLAWMLRGSSFLNDLRGGSTEPPTEKGLQALLMRQVEEGHKLLVGYSEAVAGRLARELDKKTEELNKAKEKEVERLTKMEDLIDRQFERDLKRKQAEREDEREEKIYSVLTSFVLPMVLQKLTSGKGDTPDQASAAKLLGGILERGGEEEKPSREKAVGYFLKSLELDEIGKIFEAVGPEKSQKLQELYNSYREPDAEADAEVQH
jgi:hypothetical protein